MLVGHGGNVREICKIYGISDILDFSTNVNPLGYPKGLKNVLFNNFDSVRSYPDIKNEELRGKFAGTFGKSKEYVMFGNGSTELLYLIPRVLQPVRGVVCVPSYSDYADSLSHASMPIEQITLAEEKNFMPDLGLVSSLVRKGDIVFLGNPNNPTSQTIDRVRLLELVESNPAVYFVIDESFNGFLSDWKEKTLLGCTPFPDKLLIVQSLTKLYAIPGIRIGALIASPKIISKMEKLTQPWSVNCFALQATDFIIEQEGYCQETRRFVSEERGFLYSALSSVSGLKVFYPHTNFLLVKIQTPHITSAYLQDVLLKKYNIYIRDCSNFPGLETGYFRVAVLDRAKNELLVSAMSDIFLRSC